MSAESLEKLREALTARPRDGHKGTFGTVLVVGGTLGMTGAPALCGLAALRSGAGLVRLAVPGSILPTVAGLGLEYTTVPLPETPDARIDQAAFSTLMAQAQNATVAAIGPGLGRSASLDQLIPELWEKLPVPAVFDADALNALAEISSRNGGQLPPHAALRVVTPHPGEFSRLMPDSPAKDVEPQRKNAQAFAKMNDCVVVLKGANSQISDGAQTFLNGSGNPGMATGGSGDVLTGITAAFLAQLLRRGVTPLDAVRLAVHLHGRAGDLAAAELGECSLIASDLLRFLPWAINSELSVES